MYLDSVLFVATNVLAVISAVSAAQLLGQGRERWRVLLIGLASYGLIAEFVTIALGLTGLLNGRAACVATVAVAITLAAAAGRHGAYGRNHHTIITWNQEIPGKGMLAAAVMLLCGVLGLQLIESGFGATVLRWDDLSYHATVPAQWLRDGRFSAVPSTYQAYYPFGSEVLSLWFMLAFGDDAYASLAGLYWVLLASSGIFGIVRGSGSSSAAAMLITAVFVASPRLSSSLAASFSANDLAAAASMVAAIAMALPCKPEGNGERRTELLLSALLAGLAIGCRVTQAIPVSILLAWWLLDRDRLAPRPNVAMILFWFTAMALLSGGYWYIRNWVLSGNFLFPAEIGPLWGPFDSESQTRTKVWHWLGREEFPMWQVARLANWPLLTGIVAFIGYTTLLLKAVPQRESRHSYRPASTDILVFTIGLLTILAFPFMPFSATVNRPYAEVSLNPRYAILAAILGIVLYRHVLDLKGNWRHAPLVLLLGTYLANIQGLDGRRVLLFVGFCLAGLLATGSYRWWQRHWPVSVPVLLAIWFSTLALWHSEKHRATNEGLYATGSAERPIGKAWRELDTLPTGSRIAFFMSEPAEYTQNYPLFGRKLQFQPVYVTGEGRLRKPMHALSPDDYSGWWSEWQKRASGWGRVIPDVSGDQFVRNLVVSGVDYVFCSRWSLGHWPPQQALLEQSGTGKQIYTDGYSDIWQLTRD